MVDLIEGDIPKRSKGTENTTGNPKQVGIRTLHEAAGEVRAGCKCQAPGKAGDCHVTPAHFRGSKTGGQSLTLDNNSSDSMITVEGIHTISAPVILNNNTTISGGGNLNLSGGITGNYALSVSGNLTAKSIRVNSLNIGSGGETSVPEPHMIILLGVGMLCATAYALLRRR